MIYQNWIIKIFNINHVKNGSVVTFLDRFLVKRSSFFRERNDVDLKKLRWCENTLNQREHSLDSEAHYG